MAAAKALLLAAGFRKSTATEHATAASQSGSTATKDNSQKAQDALRRGAAFASQRDKGKRSYDDMDKDEQPPLRSYDDMDKDEQQLLEDYDTGRTRELRYRFI